MGQCTLFSPVCFLPWRAAWPDVVKVAEHPWLAANGQGYLFFLVPLAPAPSLDPPMDRGGDGGQTPSGRSIASRRVQSWEGDKRKSLVGQRDSN